MCTVSNKIKFCSCLASSPDKLQHYWILHRYNKNKEEILIGEPIFQEDVFFFDYGENKAALAKRLNEPDAFDFPIVFNPKDKLEIAITHQIPFESPRTIYAFKFQNNKWRTDEHDVFDLMNHYDEYMFGKLNNIKNRLLKKYMLK